MQGVQTFFTTNHEGERPGDSAAHRETWGYYPDAKPIRSFYEGDARAAIAPFQAFQCALLPLMHRWKPLVQQPEPSTVSRLG